MSEFISPIITKFSRNPPQHALAMLCQKNDLCCLTVRLEYSGLYTQNVEIDMATSDQIVNLTETNNGTNVRPKIQPQSHFFMEGDDFEQDIDQAFGAHSADVFRTSARVTIADNKKIYTICKGQIFVQPHEGDTDKVNVILRPFKQPINEIAIKFFIYRGLKKSDFLNGSGKVASKETTEFTTYIWDEFEKFYEDEDKPTFSDYFIGWPQDGGQPETDYIERYFHKITAIDPDTDEEDPNFSYELPLVPRGIELGTTDGETEIGIDIVLDFGEYYIEGDTNPFLLDLDFARMADGKIDLTGLPTAEPEDLYQIKLLKEATTQFIDLAAFYGLHANGAGKVHTGGIPEDGEDPVDPLTTKAQIYERLGNFFTKNNLYIYIQANRQRSYNFYNNYAYDEDNSNNLKIGETEDDLAETTFGTLGWPIHVFSETGEVGTETNTVSVKLTTDNHIGAALYVQSGFITSEHENNFVRNTNLLETPSDDPEIEVVTGYTRSVQLETPSQDEHTVASLFQFIYKGKQMYVEEFHDPPQENPRNYLIKNIDNLFGLVNTTWFKVAKENELLSIIDEKTRLLNFPMINSNSGQGAVKIKIINDKIQTVDESTFLERVTYETSLTSIKKTGTAYLNTLSATLDTNTAKQLIYGTENNEFYKPTKPYSYREVMFTDNQNTITGLNLILEGSDIPTKKILGITKVENEKLVTTINLNNLISPIIYYTRSKESPGLTSNEGIDYRKFKLGVVGENPEGYLNVFYPEDVIEIYSIDDNIFFSKAYGDSIPKTVVTKDELILNFGPWIAQV